MSSTWSGAAAFPSSASSGLPIPAPDRLYFGKSYIYPLFAAPFVRVFGTSGFLVFHSLLLALCVATGYGFLVARGSQPTAAAAFAAVFIFASITPVYFFWLTPEFFNLTLVFVGVFLWAYKLAALPNAGAGRFDRFLRSPSSDYAAAVILGLVTFSKPTNIPAALPLFLLPLVQRRIRRTVLLGGCFTATVVVLFLINTAATGEPNYQGGDRKTFYSSTGFPFANTWETFENRGQRVATGSVPTEILLNRNTAIVIVWDLMYFLVGRYSGLVPYFFPGVLAALLFLARRAERQRWQWFVAARRLGRGDRPAGVYAVHLLGRRWSGRQPLFPQFLSAVPVPRPALTDRVACPRRTVYRRALHREGDAQSVLQLLPSW